MLAFEYLQEKMNRMEDGWEHFFDSLTEPQRAQLAADATAEFPFLHFPQFSGLIGSESQAQQTPGLTGSGSQAQQTPGLSDFKSQAQQTAYSSAQSAVPHLSLYEENEAASVRLHFLWERYGRLLPADEAARMRKMLNSFDRTREFFARANMLGGQMAAMSACCMAEPGLLDETQTAALQELAETAAEIAAGSEALNEAMRSHAASMGKLESMSEQAREQLRQETEAQIQRERETMESLSGLTAALFESGKEFVSDVMEKALKAVRPEAAGAAVPRENAPKAESMQVHDSTARRPISFQELMMQEGMGAPGQPADVKLYKAYSAWAPGCAARYGDSSGQK